MDWNSPGGKKACAWDSPSNLAFAISLIPASAETRYHEIRTRTQEGGAHGSRRKALSRIAFPIVSHHRRGICRGHQLVGNLESPQVDGILRLRHPWRVRSLLAYPAQRLRLDPPEGRRRVRRHALRRREARARHAHLLPAREGKACAIAGGRRVRMVRRHGAAPRRGLQACRSQVHALQNPPRRAKRVRLHRRGAFDRGSPRCRQGSLLQRHHRCGGAHGSRHRAHRSALDHDPAPRGRPAAHYRRHLRPRSRTAHHHGYAHGVPFCGHPVGQS